MIEIPTGPPLAAALHREGIDIAGLERPGHVSLSNVKIEAPMTCLSVLRMSTGRVEIGAYTHLNGGGIICACSIGRFCSIAPDVVIGQPEHPINHLTFSPLAWGEDFYGWASYNRSKGRPRKLPVAVVQGTRKHTTVGNDVWIGQGVILKAGVKIGDGAIIGAGAVVTRDVAPYSIIGGVPGKMIRKRFDDATITRLLKLKWWDYDLLSAEGLDTTDIMKALDRFEQLVSEGKIPKLEPRIFANADFAAIAAEAQWPPAPKA